MSSAPSGTIAIAIRLAAGWMTVLLFFTVGASWLHDLQPALKALLLFTWIFSITLWSAFGVVEEADHLAELLGEPLGTLVLTLSIVIIEVVLISAVMLGAKEAPTLGRDTMFAVLMIVLNGVVGLALLIGGYRHREQTYNPQGAMAYLALIVPLAVIALVIPSFTTSTTDGSLTTVQAVCFSLFTLLLYALFLVLQTGRHRAFFADPLDSVLIAGPGHSRANDPHGKEKELAIDNNHAVVNDNAAGSDREMGNGNDTRPGSTPGHNTRNEQRSGSRNEEENGDANESGPRKRNADRHAGVETRREHEEKAYQPDWGLVGRHTLLLVAAILPIVLLSKKLAILIDHGIALLQAPAALGGMLIALIVFTPEGISTLRAAYADQLQRATNLALGASGSTIGLTVPAVLLIGLWTGKTVQLGLPPSNMVLLALTLFLSLITFSGSRTTMLEGAVHLAVFFVYLVLIFSP